MNEDKEQLDQLQGKIATALLGPLGHVAFKQNVSVLQA